MTSPARRRPDGGGGGRNDDEARPHVPPPLSPSLRTRKTARGSRRCGLPCPAHDTQAAPPHRARRPALPGRRRLPDKAPGEGSREPPAEPRGRLAPPRAGLRGGRRGRPAFIPGRGGGAPAGPRSLLRGKGGSPGRSRRGGPGGKRGGPGAPRGPSFPPSPSTAGRAGPFVCRGPAPGCPLRPPPYLLRPSARWQAGRRAPPAGSACPAGRSRRPPRPAPARGRFPTSGGGSSRRARPRPHRHPPAPPRPCPGPSGRRPPPATPRSPATALPGGLAPGRQVRRTGFLGSWLLGAVTAVPWLSVPPSGRSEGLAEGRRSLAAPL